MRPACGTRWQRGCPAVRRIAGSTRAPSRSSPRHRSRRPAMPPRQSWPSSPAWHRGRAPVQAVRRAAAAWRLYRGQACLPATPARRDRGGPRLPWHRPVRHIRECDRRCRSAQPISRSARRTRQNPVPGSLRGRASRYPHRPRTGSSAANPAWRRERRCWHSWRPVRG